MPHYINLHSRLPLIVIKLTDAFQPAQDLVSLLQHINYLAAGINGRFYVVLDINIPSFHASLPLAMAAISAQNEQVSNLLSSPKLEELVIACDSPFVHEVLTALNDLNAQPLKATVLPSLEHCLDYVDAAFQIAPHLN